MQPAIIVYSADFGFPRILNYLIIFLKMRVRVHR